MKTFTTKTETVEQQEIDAIFCNKCGAQCDDKVHKDFASMAVVWGYFSRKDLEKHFWDLCEDCYDKFVATFALPPSRYEYDIRSEELIKELDQDE